MRRSARVRPRGNGALAPLLAFLLSAALAPAAGAAPRASAPVNEGALADSVRQELLHCWHAYVRYAWGHDEVRPLSRGVRDWYKQPVLMTPVDALDALLIMGCKPQADSARALIVERLSFDRDEPVQVFEVTIRLLGGLLSGYQMTGDRRLLDLADSLGTRLLPAFNSATGMPYRYVNLHTGEQTDPRSNPAEIGTLLLEFGTLAKLTKKPIYYDRAKRALVQLYERRSKIGLVGEEIDVETGEWLNPASHVGGGIDSYYEYLLKCWKLFGDKDCERMWRTSIAALNTYLADPSAGRLWYGQVDMTSGKRTATTFGALHAFLPGVLALSGDVTRARQLEVSCFAMWTLHSIEPEMIDYRTMKVLVPNYALRPEIVESACVLHRISGDPADLLMGRRFFRDLVAYCRTDDGYTTLKSVVTKEKGDLQHSFFLAETLKYLYLLFRPDPSLAGNDVVFNTEAHPLRRTWK
jgi:mannosidase alpha-like ER degradation enhancer 2